MTIVKEVAGPIDSAGPRETTPDDPEHTAPGLSITYHLEITNNGGWPAYDIAVNDEPDSLSSAGSCERHVPAAAAGRDVQPWGPARRRHARTRRRLHRVDHPCAVPRRHRHDRLPADRAGHVPTQRSSSSGPSSSTWSTVPSYFGLFSDDRVDNPDVRAYPLTPLTADGHVDVVGGALGDRVWLDVNGDGVQDAGEPGIAGVGVDRVSPVASSARPAPTGSGSPTTVAIPPQWLPEGTYTVTVDTATLPAGLTPTFDATPPPDSTSTVDARRERGQPRPGLRLHRCGQRRRLRVARLRRRRCAGCGRAGDPRRRRQRRVGRLRPRPRHCRRCELRNRHHRCQRPVSRRWSPGGASAGHGRSDHAARRRGADVRPRPRARLHHRSYAGRR